MLSEKQIDKIRKAVEKDTAEAIETYQGSAIVETKLGEFEYKWRGGKTTEICHEDEESGEYHKLRFRVRVELESHEVI